MKPTMKSADISSLFMRMHGRCGGSWWRTVACVYLAGFAALGCGRVDDKADSAQNGVASVSEEADDVGFVLAVLPGLDSPSECSPGAAPMLCEWTHAFDLVFVGEIVKLEAVTSPLVMSATNEVIDGVCPEGGWMAIGLVVTLRVLESLHGEPNTSMVRAYVGHEQATEWSADFRLSESGVLELPAYSKGVLGVGSTLGVALTYDETGEYLSMLGQDPFTVDPDGVVRDPMGIEAGCASNPTELEGTPIKELKQATRACKVDSTTLAGAARLRQNLLLADIPVGAGHAAICHPGD